MPSTAGNKRDAAQEESGEARPPARVGLGARFRIARRIAAMAAALLFCLPFHYAWQWISRGTGRPSPWPRRFLGMAAAVAGMRAETHGTPLKGKVLFLANHSSWLDILLLAGASGAAFVSKDDVAKWPVFGWLARLNRTVFIARHRRGDVRGQADALRAALAEGRPVALFPEGTTDGGAEVLPFRASLLASLFPPLPGILVQPVAIDYGAAVGAIAWVGREKAASNVMRILARPGRTRVRVDFLAPIDPAAVQDRKALAARSREEIVQRLFPAASALSGAGPSGAGADRL